MLSGEAIVPVPTLGYVGVGLDGILVDLEVVCTSWPCDTSTYRAEVSRRDRE